MFEQLLEEESSFALPLGGNRRFGYCWRIQKTHFQAIALSLDFLLEANQVRLPVSTPFNPALRIEDHSLP